MGQKENRNALSSNAEGVRRGAVCTEDGAPKARGVSMQLGSVGERCKLPQRVQAEPDRQTTFGAFLSENALSGKALNAAKESGGPVSFSNGSGRSPAAK